MALDPTDLVVIHQLYAAYCHAIDAGDGPTVAACFTPDGTMAGGSPEPVTGAEALAAFAVSVPQGVPGIRHFLGNVLVEGEGDEAKGAAYLIVLYPNNGQSSILISGRYQDRLRRTPDGWRFVSREFTIDT